MNEYTFDKQKEDVKLQEARDNKKIPKVGMSRTVIGQVAVQVNGRLAEVVTGRAVRTRNRMGGVDVVVHLPKPLGLTPRNEQAGG